MSIHIPVIFMRYTFFLFAMLLSVHTVTVGTPFEFASDNDTKQLSLSEGKMPIFTYQYDVTEHPQVPPDNPRRFSGCYVHPLYGLNGEILTDAVPQDHYHHYGIFWRWSHIAVHEPNGTRSDYSLWENDTALRQHFVRWIDQTIADDSATFTVENGWFIGEPQAGQHVMKEQVRIIAHRVKHVGEVRSRAIDFEFQWTVTDKPITLRGVEDKSYGGFTIRFRPHIPEERRGGRNPLARPSPINRITVPDGIAEGDLPETPLPWADYTSYFGDTRMEEQSVDESQLSGASVFIPRTHPDFPPTWLTRYYGPLCVGWPGEKARTFQPGEQLELRYRVWIHEGAVTVPQIEKAYEEYHAAY